MAVLRERMNNLELTLFAKNRFCLPQDGALKMGRLFVKDAGYYIS